MSENSEFIPYMIMHLPSPKDTIKVKCQIANLKMIRIDLQRFIAEFNRDIPAITKCIIEKEQVLNDLANPYKL